MKSCIKLLEGGYYFIRTRQSKQHQRCIKQELFDLAMAVAKRVEDHYANIPNFRSHQAPVCLKRGLFSRIGLRLNPGFCRDFVLRLIPFCVYHEYLGNGVTVLLRYSVTSNKRTHYGKSFDKVSRVHLLEIVEALRDNQYI